MRAVLIDHPGGPDVLTVREVDDPVAGPGEALIRVAAAGVNRADVAQREGHYPPPAGASDIPGLEVSGVVEAVGDGVVAVAVGDRVCALLAGGGYAELVAVPAEQVLALPDSVDLVDSAALPEALATVYSNVVDLAALVAGQRLLVHGGSSGIGTAAIQIGVALGARVAATASSAEKLAVCRELGAELAIDYHDEDFVEVVQDRLGGADVILDLVGGSYLDRNLHALAPDGTVAIIANQSGENPELDLGLMMRRRATVRVTGLRARPATQKAAIMAGVRDRLLPAVAAGGIRPVVDSRMPLADAPAAHRRIDAPDHIGTVLLTV